MSRFVNFSDYKAVRDNYGKSASATAGQGDADCNGFVNFADYKAVRDAFGKPCQ